MGARNTKPVYLAVKAQRHLGLFYAKIRNASVPRLTHLSANGQY